MREIPGSRLLVSLHHCHDKYANLEIVDLRNKGRAAKLYSLDGASGCNHKTCFYVFKRISFVSFVDTGFGDLTYNAKQKALGAIGVGDKTSYHLFFIDTNCYDPKNTVKLIRKSKWHSQYSEDERKFKICVGNLLIPSIIMLFLIIDNFICGLDFSPLGTSMASIDRYGVCLISDIRTNGYSYHIETDSQSIQKLIYFQFYKI